MKTSKIKCIKTKEHLHDDTVKNQTISGIMWQH